MRSALARLSEDRSRVVAALYANGNIEDMEEALEGINGAFDESARGMARALANPTMQGAEQQVADAEVDWKKVWGATPGEAEERDVNLQEMA